MQVFFVGLAGVLICVGLMLVLTEIFRGRRCSKTTVGTIVSTYVRVEYVGNARCTVNYYYPVYSYEVNGKQYIGKPQQCSKIENWFKVGDTAKISYNPYYPEDMMVKSYKGEFIAGAAFIVAGILLLIFYFLH